MVDLESGIRQHPICADFSKDEVQLLVECATQANWPARSFIFREGEEALGCYLVVSGRVAIELEIPPRARRVIQTIDEGEILGWSWLLPPYRWRFDACARRDVEAIVMDGAKLRSLLESNSGLGNIVFMKLIRTLAQRLEGARLQLLDMYGEY